MTDSIPELFYQLTVSRCMNRRSSLQRGDRDRPARTAYGFTNVALAIGITRFKCAGIIPVDSSIQRWWRVVIPTCKDMGGDFYGDIAQVMVEIKKTVRLTTNCWLT